MNTKPAAAPLRTVRVCVVEDDCLVREQLVHELGTAEGLDCVGEHRSAEEALEDIPQRKPNVVFMDINLPRMNGIECVRRLKGQLPTTQFVMLTVYEDADVIFKSLLAGAVGYILKGRIGTGSKVLEAAYDAAAGGSPLNSLIARKIVQYFHRQSAPRGAEQPLSPREGEVLNLLSKGLAYKEIADVLAISVETVRRHCHNIYEKLQVSTRTQAVVKYLGR